MSSFLVVPLVTQPAEADLAAGKTSRSDFGLIPEFCVININDIQKCAVDPRSLSFVVAFSRIPGGLSRGGKKLDDEHTR